jgi:hypothetical protein
MIFSLDNIIFGDGRALTNLHTVQTHTVLHQLKKGQNKYVKKYVFGINEDD